MESFLKDISIWLQFGGAMVTVLSALGFGFLEYYKHTPNKKTFAIIACVGGLLSALGAYYSGKDTDDKTKTIIEQGEKIKEVQTKQTQNLDELIIKSDQRTIESLEERERILNEFDKVSAELRRITENGKQKLELERPELIFKEDPFFELEDTIDYQYILKIPIINIGNRTANHFEMRVLAFKQLNGIIIEKYPVPLNIPPETTIAPKGKSEGWKIVQYGIKFNDDTKIENYKYGFFINVYFEYTDNFTGKKFSMSNCYAWRAFSKDKYKFVGCSKREYEHIHDYMKKNNIQI